MGFKASRKIQWLKNKGQNESNIITRGNRQICNHIAFKCIIVRLWSQNISIEIEDLNNIMNKLDLVSGHSESSK